MKTELEKEKILRMSNEQANKFTKECLQTALVELMSKKKFEDITITEIVKRAGVSRTAFYRNYSCKEDVVLEFSNNIIKLIHNSFNYKNNNYYDILLMIFKTINENSKKFKILLQAKLFNSFVFPSTNVLQTIIPHTSTQEHYKLLAIDAAISAIVQNWFENGMKEEPVYMANLCINIFNEIYHKNN